MSLCEGADRVPRPSRTEDPPDGGGRSAFLRRVHGREADTLYVRCRPAPGTAGAAAQAESAYRGLLQLLASESVSPAALTSELLFVGDLRRDLDPILQARQRMLGEAPTRSYRTAAAVIGQPPLDPGACLELSAQAVVPHRRVSAAVTEVQSTPVCDCEDCSRLSARIVRVGERRHAHAGNLYGAGGDAFEQTSAMFRTAEDLLREGGMSFRDVVRTWIYLRDIDRDYEEFNRARRAFFRSRGIELMPASTAVGGEPATAAHDVAMRFYAVQSPGALSLDSMSTPTLNEAWLYGSDFSRGLREEDANEITLHVSGTASVDEAGRTVHVGDFAAQAERMLVNLSSLLEAQGASFQHLVSAVAYLKRPGDAPRLRAIFRERGFEGFPCTLVEADICRPELLCETEAVAVLRLAGPEQPGTEPQ